MAERYVAKYMGLALYNDSYRQFCDLLPPGPAQVLDAACGPGNVSRYLRTLRPDLDLLGIDLAPRMVEFARRAVPSARFLVHDCRRLAELEARFHGIICAFGLPYLSPEEAAAFIDSAAQALKPGGVLYLSAMLGPAEDSGFVTFDTGDRVYVNYYKEEQILGSVRAAGLEIVNQARLPSPPNAPKATTDLVVMAKKHPRA